jgi:glycosyltransferase involved in cell wall biosynthesis
MKILALSENYPLWDRLGGDFRYLNILRLLAREHEVYIFAYSLDHYINELGREVIDKYRADLVGNGIHVLSGGIRDVLQSRQYSMVLFEYYFTADRHIIDVRYFQPAACVVLDHGDVHFRRLLSKAALTNDPEDIEQAKKVKNRELSIYRQADLIFSVSSEDAAVLHEELPNIPTFWIPNIHPVPDPIARESRHYGVLVFVGSFRHEPNIDAVLYFAKDIFPLIIDRQPGVKFRIIGFDPPSEIRSLESDSIEVLGFVPDTAPYLASSYISVAPVRYGGGVKGKVGEAMAHSLPVVTTAIGADGMSAIPGKDILVSDTPLSFANDVVRLLEDVQLYELISTSGYQYVKKHYSDEAVIRVLEELQPAVESCGRKKLDLKARLAMKFQCWLNDNITWRFSGR